MFSNIIERVLLDTEKVHTHGGCHMKRYQENVTIYEPKEDCNHSFPWSSEEASSADVSISDFNLIGKR